MSGAFDFPSNPAIADEYVSSAGLIYKWNGKAWDFKPADAMVSTEYVLKAGDIMVGQLETIPPLNPFDATNKLYVDEAIAAQSLYQGVWLPATNVPDLTPTVVLPLHSYSWIAQVTDPTGIEVPPAGIPGLSGVNISSADTVIWNDTLQTYEIVRSPAAASGFLQLVGGTMTGPIVMGEGAGIRWGNTSAVTSPLMFDEGICLYGWGTSSKFGFSITSGTLNIAVENPVNQIDTVVGPTRITRVNSAGLNVSGVVTSLGITNSAAEITSSKHIRVTGGQGFAFNPSDNSAWQTFLYAGSFQLQIIGGSEARIRAWTPNGNYTDSWAFETTVANTGPGVNVNGNLVARQLINRDATHIRCAQVEGYGIEFFGGATLYKRSGHSILFRKQASNTPIRIEDNDGSNVVNIATTAMTTTLTVEELISENAKPLLDRIAKLETIIARLSK